MLICASARSNIKQNHSKQERPPLRNQDEDLRKEHHNRFSSTRQKMSRRKGVPSRFRSRIGQRVEYELASGPVVGVVAQHLLAAA
jgi:hypothetical protein